MKCSCFAELTINPCKTYGNGVKCNVDNFGQLVIIFFDFSQINCDFLFRTIGNTSFARVDNSSDL